MRKAGFLMIMALLALPASALAQADEYSKPSLKDMTPKWQAAYNAGDAAGLAALYATDGVLHPPNSAPVDGREAIEAFWAAVLESGGSTELTVKDVHSMGESAAEVAGDDDFRQVAAKRLNDTANPESGEVKLDVILDIPVTIGMEIGRTQLSIRNLLQLNQGSIVELDRLAGEPMDVLVNGTLVAHGEVVVVNEKFGIRLTDVVSPADRIKNLR